MNRVPSDRVLRGLVPAFRLVANLEAASWAGLLVGMAFKYLVAERAVLGEELVTVFGSLHGGLVIAYLALAGAVALHLRWPLKTAALAAAATLPPFATVVFDRWAHRAGAYVPDTERWGGAGPSGTDTPRG